MTLLACHSSQSWRYGDSIYKEANCEQSVEISSQINASYALFSLFGFLLIILQRATQCRGDRLFPHSCLLLIWRVGEQDVSGRRGGCWVNVIFRHRGCGAARRGRARRWSSLVEGGNWRRVGPLRLDALMGILSALFIHPLHLPLSLSLSLLFPLSTQDGCRGLRSRTHLL